MATLARLPSGLGATCYCRLDGRAQGEVAFRLARGTRSVEVCVDLFAQLLTPPDVLAAELTRAAETALRPRRARARIPAPRS